METLGRVGLRLEGGLRFGVDFGVEGAARLTTDAAPPLGGAGGPDSEQLLVAAVANCLAGSLVVSLRKYRNEVPMDVSATATAAPNEQGRQRMTAIAVDIRLGAVAGDIRFLDRALAQFEDFCVVTQSVRAAIPVAVRVFDATGALLKA